MAEVLMIKCDNPACDSIDKPEYVPGQASKRKRNDKAVAPYAWHQGRGQRVGCGPTYDYVACSYDCISPAISELVRQAADGDGG